MEADRHPQSNVTKHQTAEEVKQAGIRAALQLQAMNHKSSHEASMQWSRHRARSAVG
jgi:hypothetical protein